MSGGERRPESQGSELPPWSWFRAELERAGFRPSRRRGQNFLRDVNMARAIVRDSAVGAGDRVLEVGPGCGFLTVHLLERDVRLVAVEIDERLARIVSPRIEAHPEATLMVADVLAGKHEVEPRVVAALPATGAWHLVSSLPYGVAAPLLVGLSRLPNPPVDATVLVQLELAERVLARPGSRERGPLGLRLESVYRAALLRRVRPELFWPRPKVESAVLRLELRDRRPGAEDLAVLDGLVGELFMHRRQSLERHLARLTGDRALSGEVLVEHGLDPRSRPQDLGLDALLGLASDRRLRPPPTDPTRTLPHAP